MLTSMSGSVLCVERMNAHTSSLSKGGGDGGTGGESMDTLD